MRVKEEKMVSEGYIDWEVVDSRGAYYDFVVKKVLYWKRECDRI